MDRVFLHFNLKFVSMYTSSDLWLNSLSVLNLLISCGSVHVLNKEEESSLSGLPARSSGCSRFCTRRTSALKMTEQNSDRLGTLGTTSSSPSTASSRIGSCAPPAPPGSSGFCGLTGSDPAGNHLRTQTVASHQSCFLSVSCRCCTRCSLCTNLSSPSRSTHRSSSQHANPCGTCNLCHHTGPVTPPVVMYSPTDNSGLHTGA